MGFFSAAGRAAGRLAADVQGGIQKAELENFENQLGRQIAVGNAQTDPALNFFIKDNPNNDLAQGVRKYDREERAKRAPKTQSTSQLIDDALFSAANDIDLSTNIKQKMFPSKYEKRMAGTALNDLGIDISPDSKSKRSSDLDRIKLGDKDKRSFLAEEKLRIANDLAGGGFTRDQLVDMLNQPGVQQGEQLINALNSDDRIRAVADLENEGYFIRPEMEAPSFVGEGQFGRVTELAPGYVSKKQEPLVEFGGYQTLEDGSMSPRGNLIGRIHDYRDVQDEANQLNYLNKKAKGITPRVENLIIEDDGSTEMIMRDLRENYGSSDEFLADTANRFQNADLSVAERTKAYKDHQLFQVRRSQQEAQAALAGVELQDRHLGNVMVHEMTNRPLQIDPSGRQVAGFERDAVVGSNVVEGFRSAGLEDEAEIFNGLLNDAFQRKDSVAFHDLAQQGMSRLMKIKRI